MKTKMRLCDIIIPEDFEKYTPREEKSRNAELFGIIVENRIDMLLLMRTKF